MRRKIYFILTLVFCTALASYALLTRKLPLGFSSSEVQQSLPDLITYTQPGLLPEGIDYAKQCQCFVVSSVGQGQVGKVSLEGKYTSLTQDPELISSFGLLVDESRNRVLIALGDYGWSQKSSALTRLKVAKLGIYDLTTGARLQLIDLAALSPSYRKHMANDIAMDAEGNAYMTDSFAPVIYKVTPTGEASIFLEHERLGGGSFAQNGIVYHPSGHLIVARSDNQSLYRVPLAQSSEIQEIRLDQRLPRNPDGLELMPDQRIGVIAHHEAKVTILESDDQWLSARVEAQASLEIRKPTTMVAVGSVLYALESGFNLKPPPDVYRIEKVNFGPKSSDRQVP